jgi:hypothetical protein
MRFSDVLVDLGILPIQDICQLLKSAWEVMLVVDLILQCLQEALTSGAGLWAVKYVLIYIYMYVCILLG